MLVLITVENGVKKIIPLTADAGAGNPVGTVIVVCSNQIPSNYLPLGTQYDTSLYPVLYALLGTDTTPTASALGLPTLTSGQYAIKATSGLSENAQDNVINTLNEQRSYSTEEVNTGKKWIDGKPIYRKVVSVTLDGTQNQHISYNIPNIETVTSLDGYVSKLSDYARSLNFCYYGSLDWSSAISVAPTEILLEMGSSFVNTYANENAYVILEYTKTTD